MFPQYQKKRNLFLMGMLFLMLLSGLTVHAQASWVKNGDGTYSYRKADGTIARSRWIGKKYYVDAQGIRLTGKQKIRSKWYYFSPTSGKLKKNKWVCIDGDYYYFGKDGSMVKSRWLSGYKFYLDSKGRRVSGRWVGSRYLGSNGRSYSGLHKISGTYYYFDPKTRKKVTNTFITIKKKRWYFDSEGEGAVNEVPEPGEGVSVQPQYYTHPVVDDETLLSYIIYCEAGNQPYEGKMAIGYIILNRVYSETFPASTVREVVYQTGQFGPVWNSTLLKVYEDPSVVDEESRAAAKAVMKKQANIASGKTVKLKIDGKNVKFPYLYFLNLAGYRLEGLTAAYLQIGTHVFFSSWG